MSVIDRFLTAIKLNDDGFEEEDYLDEEEEFDDDPKTRRRFTADREDDLFDQNDDIFDQQEKGSSRIREASLPKTKSRPTIRSKKGSSNGMEVCVIKPHSMDDAQIISDSLLNDCTVILNIESMDIQLAQRIIDYSSGTCYALHGQFCRISRNIFVISPSSVDVSGDFQELISSAFDIPYEARY